MENPPACKAQGGAAEMVDKMPRMCGGGGNPCLTTDQIKTISDWIQAGAPM
jgi:hypothetical protein